MHLRALEAHLLLTVAGQYREEFVSKRVKHKTNLKEVEAFSR